MAHWRDGGIGNMAGSDDREAEEFTLLERLTVIAGHSKTDAQFDVAGIAQDAWDFIEPLTAAARRGEPMPMPWAWQPIATAQVEPFLDWDRTVRFKCLLQTECGDVFEGHGAWVKLGAMPKLRWYDACGRWRTVKYWMPLPAPKVEP